MVRYKASLAQLIYWVTASAILIGLVRLFSDNLREELVLDAFLLILLSLGAIVPPILTRVAKADSQPNE